LSKAHNECGIATPAFVEAIVEGNVPLATSLQMIRDGRIVEYPITVVFADAASW